MPLHGERGSAPSADSCRIPRSAGPAPSAGICDMPVDELHQICPQLLWAGCRSYDATDLESPNRKWRREWAPVVSKRSSLSLQSATMLLMVRTVGTMEPFSSGEGEHTSGIGRGLALTPCSLHASSHKYETKCLDPIRPPFIRGPAPRRLR